MKTARILIILTALAISWFLLTTLVSGVVYLAVSTPPPVVVKEPAYVYKALPIPQKTYTQAPEIKAIMDSLGLDYSKLNLIYGDNPAYPDSHQASFTGPDKLYLSPNHTANINKLLSHEYIHFAQSKDITSSSFNTYLDELYQGQWLRNRMSSYKTCATCDTRREVQAVACTEISDNYLRADFLAWCNKYLPKRALLF